MGNQNSKKQWRTGVLLPVEAAPPEVEILMRDSFRCRFRDSATPTQSSACLDRERGWEMGDGKETKTEEGEAGCRTFGRASQIDRHNVKRR
jgi:hypothetical protein